MFIWAIAGPGKNKIIETGALKIKNRSGKKRS